MDDAIKQQFYGENDPRESLIFKGIAKMEF